MVSSPLIQLDRLTKRFGGVTALDEVSFAVHPGEIHAIVGENGAGKSTLMKLLAGVHLPDAGEIRIESRGVRLNSPRAAQRLGISIVFQELSQFPHRSVSANLFANREQSSPWGFLRRRAMRQAAAAALTRVGVSISPDARVESLSIGERQLVEIARALDRQSRIIILDEPNSALNEAESQRLFRILRELRARGHALLYVSHRLEEVFAMADRVTVLRDGRYQGTWRTAETTISRIISAMIGRPIDQLFPPRLDGAKPGPVVLQVRDLCAGPRLGPISFSARAGEIVGFAGLEGAGINKLFEVLFGLERRTGGEVIVRGVSGQSATPRTAMRQGWGLVPESRRDQGLDMNGSVARNATSLIWDALRLRVGLIDRRQVRAQAIQAIADFAIAAEGPQTPVAHLSGGNQQKVLLAKWLASKPSILILNNPTRGVDVGAKWEIYELCRKLAAQGMTLLLGSEEIEELLGLSDRLLVLANGRLLGEHQPEQITKAELLRVMAGASATEMNSQPSS